MKKLVRKLALSCVALAACALTLVSTTYAWWTTNTEVNATSIQGQASTVGDASIYISTNGTDWAQSVDLEDLMYNWKDSGNVDAEGNHIMVKDTLKFADLNPVQLKKDASGNHTYTTLDNQPGKVLTFDLYFKTAVTSEDVTIYLSDVILKGTGAVTASDNLLNNTTNSTNVGVDRNSSTYWVDIVKALGMVSEAEDTSETTKYIDLEKVNNQTAAPFRVDQNITGSAAAVAYYNEVMQLTGTDAKEQGEDVIDYNVTALGTTSSVIVVCPKEGTAVKVTFTIFLNGWDEYCYDACKGQGFDLDLEFKAVPKATA